MLRVIRISVGLLALGVVTSVLVAWGCFALALPAWPAKPTWSASANSLALTEFNSQRAAMWRVHRFRGVTIAGLASSYPIDWRNQMYLRRTFEEDSSFAFHWSVRPFVRNQMAMTVSMMRYPPSAAPLLPHENHQELHLFGWPWRCVARRMQETTTANPLSVSLQPMDEWSAPVPMIPILRGLSLNTLFYASIWAIPLVLIPYFIRWHRARDGMCPTCGYDCSGLSTCPECGTSATESASP